MLKGNIIMSMFDPNVMLDQEVQGANATKVKPCPAGEYTAIIDGLKLRSWAKKDDPTVNGVSLDVMLDIQDEAVKAELGRDKVLVKHSCSLDFVLDAEGKPMLNMHKDANVDLGRLRTACGLNDPKRKFTLNQLNGQAVKVLVGHPQDPEDPETVYAEVGRGKVTAL